MSDSNAYSDTWRAYAPFAYEFEPVMFWVVTQAPLDLPEWPFVARQWKDGKPTTTHYCSRSLAALRLLLRRDEGCQLCIERDPNDDPVIVETWL
jgi:hypothetical protein